MPSPKKKIFPKRLSDYLKSKGFDPKVLEHRTAYTAIDAANTLKRKLNEIVKSLLVRADDYYYIVCLPADHNIDFKKIKSAVEKEVGKKVKAVLIPDEKTMSKVLKIKDEGLTAFGGLYKVPVLLEKKLSSLKKAVFSSGNFHHSLEMGIKEFSNLENVILANFGIKKKIKIINMRPSSSSKMKKGANKTMATKKKVAKKAVKKVAKKKTAKKAAKKKTTKKK
jgi:prolyl-tRNA editing enzyme YbaK/EbsC (Cys-tRNA(Pro) deacylase)